MTIELAEFYIQPFGVLLPIWYSLQLSRRLACFLQRHVNPGRASSALCYKGIAGQFLFGEQVDLVRRCQQAVAHQHGIYAHL